MTDNNSIEIINDDVPSIISLDDQSSFEQIPPRKFSNTENGHHNEHSTSEEFNLDHHTQFISTKQENQEEIPIGQLRRASTSSDHSDNQNSTDFETKQENEEEIPSEEVRRTSTSSANRNSTDFEMNREETSPLEQRRSSSSSDHSTKAQRQIDEDEIPPPELIVDPNPIVEQRRISSSSDRVFNDDRPLTDLEKPFEHKEEEQVTEDYSLNESIPIEINPITLSAFLPDAVVQQTNGDTDQANGETVVNEMSPSEFTEEDFPPLPPPEKLVPVPLYDQEYPPLSATKTEEEEEEKIIPSKVEDLLGNRTLLKQTLVKGEPNSRPTRSTMVTISYELSIVNPLTSESRLIETINREEYLLSESDLIPAIDISIQSMDRGEIALIDSDVRHCYGEIGCEEKQLPPVSSLNPYRMKIHLEVHQWSQPIDVQLLSIDDRLKWGEKKKEMGNFYYRRQDYPNALQSYQGARRFLDIDLNPLSIASDPTILNEQLNRVLNNLAQVYLLMNNNQSCLDAVNRILRTDPKNIKALFRQGKALFQLGLYDQAIQSLKTYTKFNSSTTNNQDHDKALEIISICEQKLANYKKDQKEMYQRMFQTPKPSPTPTQIVNGNSSWWPYIAIGAVVLTAAGIVTLVRSRKTL